MEDRTIRVITPTTLVRRCEGSRLQGQFMSDAYEWLVPLIQRRCDDLQGGSVGRGPVAAEHEGGQSRRACCAGGVP